MKRSNLIVITTLSILASSNVALATLPTTFAFYSEGRNGCSTGGPHGSECKCSSAVNRAKMEAYYYAQSVCSGNVRQISEWLVSCRRNIGIIDAKTGAQFECE